MARPPRQSDDLGRYQCPPGNGCGEWLLPEQFFRNKRTSSGLSTYCKECHVRNQRRTFKRHESKQPPRPDNVPEDAIYVAGYGWVLPIGVPDVPYDDTSPVHMSVGKELRNMEAPEAARKAFKAHAKKLRAMTDMEVMQSSSSIDVEAVASLPEDEQSPWERALLAELQARFGSEE
jgi:hypothetical protein